MLPNLLFYLILNKMLFFNFIRKSRPWDKMSKDREKYILDWKEFHYKSHYLLF